MYSSQVKERLKVAGTRTSTGSPQILVSKARVGLGSDFNETVIVDDHIMSPASKLLQNVCIYYL